MKGKLALHHLMELIYNTRTSAYQNEVLLGNSQFAFRAISCVKQ